MTLARRAGRRRLLPVLAALVVALGVLSAACGLGPAAPSAPTQQPKPLRFMAGYKPQANLPFVAVYVAQQLGYFAEQGLSVDISHATGQGEHLKLLLQGTVDVTTAAADAVLMRRAEELPVVAFAVLGQRSQSAFAVRADGDIRSPRDWEGKTVGYKVYPSPEYLALLAAAGVDRGRVREVPVGFDPRLLAAGKVDVYPVYESNEPDTLERLGVPVRLFRAGDYGVPGLGLTYLTRQALLEQDPDALARFLKAALRGIAFAQQNPDAAVEIVMRYAPEEDRTHQAAMLRVELEMAEGPTTREPGKGIGWATPDQWRALRDSLLAYGGLKAPVSVDAAFTDTVLRAAYTPGGEARWP